MAGRQPGGAWGLALGAGGPDVTGGVPLDLLIGRNFDNQSAVRRRDLDVVVSRRALEQLFQAKLQRGIAAEIRRTHLERAAHLLTTSNLPASEVARQSGFGTVHHLSRLFHREIGETPTSFRRRLGRA